MLLNLSNTRKSIISSSKFNKNNRTENIKVIQTEIKKTLDTPSENYLSDKVTSNLNSISFSQKIINKLKPAKTAESSLLYLDKFSKSSAKHPANL